MMVDQFSITESQRIFDESARVLFVFRYKGIYIYIGNKAAKSTMISKSDDISRDSSSAVTFE